MKRIIQSVRRSASRVVMTAAVVVAAAGPVAAGEPAETLFLRDGTVVRGTVIDGPEGSMLIDGRYGCLTVELSEVLFRITPAEPDPVVADTYVLGGSATGAVLTTDRPVPPPSDGVTTFALLVPGKLLEVSDTDDRPVPSTHAVTGPVSRAIVRYSDVPEGTSMIRVSAKLDDLLEELPDGTLRFTQNYTPDDAGMARVAVAFPAEWKVISASPTATVTDQTLIVWQTQLRRQQRFAPEALLRR
jgi:hypothetical protein